MYVNYNAIITEQDGVFYVGIPGITDFEDGEYGLYATYGESYEEAITLGRDILVLHLNDLLEENREFPCNVSVKKLNKILDVNQSIICYSLDLIYEISKINKTYKKKSVSIPVWLDLLGQKHNLNFSQILQKALKKELGLID